MARKNGSNKDDVLIGTSGSDIIMGLAGNDFLKGLNGDDTLFGGDGNDTLDGGKGDDELLGGKGNDLFLPGGAGSGADAMDGGAGIDTVSYANFNTDVGVSVTLNYSSQLSSDDSDGDTFVSIENFIGSKASDFFDLTDYQTDARGYVDGGAGDDEIHGDGRVMRGGAGADTLVGDISRTKVDTFWLELDGENNIFQNFTYGQDRFRISGKEFGVGALINSNELFNRASDSDATGTKAQFIFRQDEEQLFFDSDGTGGDAAILLIDFDLTSSIYTLSVTDFAVV